MDKVTNTFKVSERRKEVWNTELEMLEIFKSICDQEGIKYFAIGGTLLGAVRHNGYIPWDDDLDVVMLREDYDQFIEAAKKKMPDGFFLQIPETEDDYFFGHAKIRKNNTTAIRFIQYPERYSHHQGVFLDIFPLDRIPDNPILYKIHKYIALKLMQIVYYAKYYYRLNKHSLITKIKHRFCTIILPSNKSIRRAFNIFEWWIKLPQKKTKRIGQISTYYHKDHVYSWETEWFNESIEHVFENTTISIPREYDKILTKTFGDYMKPVRVASEHGEVYFDLHHDYTEYISGKRVFTENDLVL